MDNESPYEPPKAKLDTAGDNKEEVLKVAKGQKKVIYAVLLNILANVVQIYIGQIALLVTVAALVISIYGIIQMSKGMGYSVLTICFLFVLFLLPLVNILTLLYINSKATAKLRNEGYTVGLMGARM